MHTMADSPFQRRRSGLLRGPLHSTVNTGSLSVTLLPEELSISENTMICDDDLDRGMGKTDALFAQFLEVLHSHNNDTEVFDVVEELSQSCRAVVEQLEIEIDRGVGGAHGTKQRELNIGWLKQEINTWRLLHSLYHDRVLQGDTAADDEMQGPTPGGSEKEVIVQLYAINSTLREYQVVVDWLEMCYEPKETAIAAHCHDRMMAWENTLFELEKPEGAAFGRGHEIVRQLDPDAPVREKKPLHADDEEDNKRLGRGIFSFIRKGRVDDALKLCKHYGQTWRASILEGWRLHEDPNYDNQGMAPEKMPILGNPRRDVWKRCAWMMADSKKYDEYTRATMGVFSGHLGSLKALLQSSWHDLLWAYIKVQIDIRVESEIRGCCMKRYHQLPDEYWNGKMTLEQIFDELEVAKNAAVRDYAQSQMGVIQKHLILDTCGELLQYMCRWVDVGKDSTLPPHQLRFMAHIVLFMRQIGRVEQEQYAERILAAYVEALIQRKEPQLISYYAATLSNKLQVRLYAKFLEQLDETRARQEALEAALQMGLDVEQITQCAVESIRLSNSPESAVPHAGEISVADRRKIQSLELLTHLVEQRGELIWQANAMMRHFLSASKIECMREITNMMPSDVIGSLTAAFGSPENLPLREDCSLKEYLCYSVYLTAVDRFNEWTRLQQCRPKPPQSEKSNNFTERIATEHKELNYQSDLTRWEHKVKELSKVTVDALYNVLLFPRKGWLIDPSIGSEHDNSAELNWENRQLQMEKLRSICLPEIALLLHEVMYKSGDYTGCVRLADEIADERRQLYKVYTQHKLAELLSKIADASLKLLNDKLDAWGYPFTA
ncbi:nuclear pore complex protein Nup107 [Scaptodrosophila lebanonensis]|uniref:Nuclear pore complex protein n=1 Tax=Drosophila lebanonensis TaxID=7225 RepID=A0A6J2U4A6_DROLE|nr:nuclear pore complex protein Nup107 [Scaptodrosophila lebanonensis]